jgi:hypothetical protein
MTFFSKKKVIKIFPFHIYFSHLCKISNQKKPLVMTCVFECYQSQCHILKELHEFLHMMGAITIFEFKKKNWCCGLWIGDKVTWRWVHIWGGGRENKLSKDECEIFNNQNY